jgi:hypothetical protein
MIGLLTLLMATAFVNSAAARDFSLNTYPMISPRLCAVGASSWAGF